MATTLLRNQPPSLYYSFHHNHQQHQQHQRQNMRLITGDECGLLKECLPELTQTASTQSKSNTHDPRVVSIATSSRGISRLNSTTTTPTTGRKHGVVDLTWTQPTQDQAFAALRLDGVVQLWERTRHESKSGGQYQVQIETQRNVFCDKNDETSTSASVMEPATKPLGLFAFPSSNHNNSSNDSNDQSTCTRLCAANARGNVVVLNPHDKSRDSWTRFSTVHHSTDDNHNKKHNKYGNPYITAFAVDATLGHVAVGGQERDVTLWNVATQQCLWKAKNLSADPQTLLAPQVWPSCVQKLPAEHLWAVGSAHKEVRLYDVRTKNDGMVQRRPLSYTTKSMLEHRVTALCPVDDVHLVCGDAAGDLHTLDLRNLKGGTKSRRYAGPAGSVRQLQKHATCHVMAAVGLDRMLRLYDTNTRKQLHCIYLRQRLNCVLFGQEEDWNRNDNNDDDNEDGDVDQEDQVEDYQDSDLEQEEQDDNDNNDNWNKDSCSDKNQQVSDDDNREQDLEIDEEEEQDSESESEDDNDEDSEPSPTPKRRKT